MHIGIDGNEANQNVRVGSGVYVYNLLKMFRNRENDGIKFWVYLKNKPLKDMPLATNNFHYKIIKPEKLWTQIALPITLWREKIQGTCPDVFFSPSHYVPRMCPIPSVVTIFDLSFIKYPSLFEQKDLFILKNGTSFSVKQAEYIITISEFSKKEIMNYYHVDGDKISVTYPGYDKLRFNKEVNQEKSRLKKIRDKYGIRSPYLLFIGTLQPRKNLIKLLEVFKMLLKENKNLQLVVAGMINEGRGGWMQSAFFAKIKELNLQNNLLITGYIPDDEVPYLMCNAKVLVLPSIYEGFGIPVVEAFACGCPVVSSNSSSLKEIVSDAGMLVEPQDIHDIAEGIRKVLNDDKLRNRLIQKGYERAQFFDWTSCADKTLNILKKYRKNTER